MYKRLVYVLVYSVVIAYSATGQVRFGVSGGADVGRGVMFRAALPLEWQWTDWMGLQSEFAFSQQENSLILRKLASDHAYQSASIAYLELPVLAKFTLPLEVVHLYALLGPKFSYALKSVAWYQDNGVFFSEEVDWSMTKFRRFDFGLFTGLGLQKELPNGFALFVDFRYYLGLMNLDTMGGAELYNQGRVINLGVLIPFRHQRRTQREEESRFLPAQDGYPDRL